MLYNIYVKNLSCVTWYSWKILIHWVMQIFQILAYFIIQYFLITFVKTSPILQGKSLSSGKLSSLTVAKSSFPELFFCLITWMLSLATNTFSFFLEVTGSLYSFLRRCLPHSLLCGRVVQWKEGLVLLEIWIITQVFFLMTVIHIEWMCFMQTSQFVT